MDRYAASPPFCLAPSSSLTPVTLVAAYSLTVGTFILPAGRLGEIFGYKPVFLAGTMWYALWSLIAGVSYYSGTIIFFDFCRAMQGIGPSIMLPNAIAILGVTYPPGKRKELIFGIFGATAPSGFNIGAVFASLFAQEVYWPWGYYLMAIACLLLAGLSFWVVPNTPNIAAKTGPFNVMRMDPLGMFVGVTGLVLINFSWNQGPVAGWTTPYVYAILIVGFVFMAAFFYLELRVSEFPLVPLKKISGKSGFVLGCIAAGWGSFGIWVFYLWNFCLELRKQTPILTAAQVVPTSVSGLVAAVTTGLILSKVRPSIIMLIAMLAFTVGAVLLATMPVEQTYWAQMFVACIVTPWGMDMSFPSGTIIMSNSMPREEQGTAASLVNTVLNYSISIGLGMAGTIERYVVPVEDSDAARLRAYRAVWYLGIGLAGLGVCVASAFVVQDHAASKREAELKPEKSSSQEKEAA